MVEHSTTGAVIGRAVAAAAKPSLRIPITQDRLIEDNYLDAYFDVISKTDPLTTPLVFSCGMGAVRTTFAMTAACIIRRRQLIENGEPDPYAAPAVGLMSAPTVSEGLSRIRL